MPYILNPAALVGKAGKFLKVNSTEDGYDISDSGAVLSNTATLNFDLTSVNYQDLTMALAGAVAGDSVSLGVPNGAMVADVTFFAWVSASDVVSVRCSRVGGGAAANPASGIFKATIIR